MRNTQQALPFEGNRIEAYTQGATFLQALLRAISEARHHIHLEFYIFEDDAVGRLVRDALLQKAQEGVQVRVILRRRGLLACAQPFF